jgi:hypothetical protein
MGTGIFFIAALILVANVELALIITRLGQLKK